MNEIATTNNMTENSVRIFENEEFGSVRTVEVNGEIWFVGKDVAEVLGYSNSSKAVLSHVDDEDKKFTMLDITDYQNGNVPIGQSKTAIINESGIYSLILKSKLPKAKKFKHWVTSEILPSIRQHGAYMTPETIQQAITSPDFLIKLAMELKSKQQKIDTLTSELENSAVTIDGLVFNVSTWDKRSVLNALVRKFAGRTASKSIANVWSTLFFNVKMKYHIDVFIRKGKDKGKNKNKPYISYITDDEMDKCISVAIALCKAANIDIGETINKVNESIYCG